MPCQSLALGDVGKGILFGGGVALSDCNDRRVERLPHRDEQEPRGSRLASPPAWISTFGAVQTRQVELQRTAAGLEEA